MTAATTAAPGKLTGRDLAMFDKIGVAPDLLEAAHVERVTDRDAREKFGITGPASRNMAGIVLPYYSPVTGNRVTARVRRDNPEVEDGKPKNKYISAYGDGRHLYFPPGASEKLQDPTTPIVLVEAEKSTLALTAWATRNGKNTLPIAMGGCWGWHGRIGKTESATGGRVDVEGPLPDLAVCDGRPVYILLDANAESNSKVAVARKALAKELQKRGCTVKICELSEIEGVNGPDDFIGAAGDEAMTGVFAAAYAPTARARKNTAATETKLALSSTPKPVVPPLSAREAAIRTGDLLETCLRWITRYVVVSNVQAVILATWLLHTYVMDACDWTPYLHITGPEKACGKTLMMDALAAIACNPRTGSGASPAALVRIVDKYAPTLFLDEVDTITGGNKEMAEAIRGILDAGFKRGGVVLKCDGKDNEVREFSAFGPKVFAGIGALPDTIASRAIPIEMRRKLRSERVERYRARVVAQLATPVKAELEQWGTAVTAQLKSIVPMPIDALSDRANDVTEILLAIAQLAGGDWLQRLNTALLTVYGSAVADDTSTGVVLLTDTRNIFAERETVYIPSKELVAALNEIEGRPWAEWSRGRGLSPNNLARLLSKYHILPITIRVAGETPKGYRKADFIEAWDRYCGHSDFSTATPTQPASLLEKTAFSNRNTKNDVAVQKASETRMDIGLWQCGVSKLDIPTQESFSDASPGLEGTPANLQPGVESELTGEMGEELQL